MRNEGGRNRGVRSLRAEQLDDPVVLEVGEAELAVLRLRFGQAQRAAVASGARAAAELAARASYGRLIAILASGTGVEPALLARVGVEPRQRSAKGERSARSGSALRGRGSLQRACRRFRGDLRPVLPGGFADLGEAAPDPEVDQFLVPVDAGAALVDLLYQPAVGIVAVGVDAGVARSIRHRHERERRRGHAGGPEQ